MRISNLKRYGRRTVAVISNTRLGQAVIPMHVNTYDLTNINLCIQTGWILYRF